MSLQTRLEALASAVGADIKSINAKFTTLQQATVLDGGATPSEPNSGTSGLYGIESAVWSGTLSQRPLPSGGPRWYFANNDNGGTLYYSDGVTWSKFTPSLGEIAGVELGYAEITSSQAITSRTLADLQIPLSISVNVGSRPIVIEAYVPQSYASGSVGNPVISLMEGSTILMNSNQTAPALNAIQAPILLKQRLTPSPGVHTYKVQAAMSGTGAYNLYAPTAGVPSIYLQAVSM